MPRSLHKSNCRNIKSLFAALLATALLLSGCEGASQPSDQKETMNYRITEKPIPDPKTDFENNPENQGKNWFSFMEDSVFETSVFADARVILSPINSFSSDGKICMIYDIMYQMENEDLPSFTDSCCICVLDSPYEQWQYYTFSSDCWSSDLSYSSSSIVGVSDDGVYLCLNLIDDNHYSVPSRIGFYGWGGSCQLLDEPSTDSGLNALTLYSADESLYAVFGAPPGMPAAPGSSFTVYDEQLSPVLSQNLDNQLSGCISRDSEYLWYGFDGDQNLTIWDKPNGTKLFSLGNAVNPYSDCLLTASPAGGFILADFNSIWIGSEDTPLEKAVSFTEKGYALQELLTISANEDGTISLVVRFDDELFLLLLEQTETSDTQEITIVSYGAFLLTNVAAAFNRQSDKYHIALVNPNEMADSEDYLRQLQMELSAGRGPDLVSPWVIDMESCIRNGYLEPLDDLIGNVADYWPACLENGRTDGILYGIPYRVALSFLVTSESLAGSLDSWTLEQMINAVQGSPAESLEKNMSGIDIVLQYGLMTPDNPQFIDYDAGVSHLAEQPFIDFLEFAYKYSDRLDYPSQEQTAEYYKNGTLAVYYLTMNGPADFFSASDFFQSHEVLIGMPAAQGRGVRMSSDLLCLNSNSQCKEGAKEFLRYLVSAEGQSRLVQSDSFNYSHGAFSCRRDVTESVLNHYQESMAAGEIYVRPSHSIYPLSEAQIDQFWALFEDAGFYWPWPSEIRNIAYEELEPYFAGDCSAEEAAEKLDNRVQLYFDERK